MRGLTPHPGATGAHPCRYCDTHPIVCEKCLACALCHDQILARLTASPTETPPPRLQDIRQACQEAQRHFAQLQRQTTP